MQHCCFTNISIFSLGICVGHFFLLPDPAFSSDKLKQTAQTASNSSDKKIMIKA